jgi:MoxR-like ATPase
VITEADSGAMRQVLCPVLVGRDEELQILLDALDRAVDGHGGTLFVEGEAGVGKSRLVRELARRATSERSRSSPGVESPVVLGEGLLRLLSSPTPRSATGSCST